MSSSTMQRSGGVAAALANMKVRSKISLGFGLLLVLLTVVGGLGTSAMIRVNDSFDVFALRTAILAHAEDIAKEFTNLRRFTGEFAVTGDEERAARAEEAGKHVKASAADALAAARLPARRKVF